MVRVNYENSLIYKLCCKDTDVKDIYVGSTTNFRLRKCGHKSQCHNIKCKQYNYYVYQFIRDNGGFENWDMIEVEKYPTTDKKNLEKRERYWTEELCASLNKVIIGRTRKEWHEDNKEHVAEYQREWRKDNDESLVEYKKDYYQNNKEHLINESKKRYDEKKEKILIQQKAGYSKKKGVKVICECGSEVTFCNLPKHKQTKKHLEFTTGITIPKVVKPKKIDIKIICECGCEINESSLTRHKKTKKHKKLINK